MLVIFSLLITSIMSLLVALVSGGTVCWGRFMDSNTVLTIFFFRRNSLRVTLRLCSAKHPCTSCCAGSAP